MEPQCILLIDPFKNLLNAYRIILEEENFSVETALNTEEARTLFDQKVYSTVMMEYLPPHGSICEMVQWMKEKAPEIYIIMVTNTAVDEMVYEDLFEVGVDDFILKPYSPKKIITHIRKGLRQREMISRIREYERLNLLAPVSGDMEGLIFNKTYLKHHLKQEIKRSKRHQHHFSLLLIQMRDGERVKKPSAYFYAELLRIIRKFIRAEDVVAKNNGEIVLLLPETDQNGSEALSGRLSGLIHNHPPFQHDELLHAMTQTLSFQHVTYPDQFDLPAPLNGFITGDDKQSMPH